MDGGSWWGFLPTQESRIHVGAVGGGWQNPESSDTHDVKIGQNPESNGHQSANIGQNPESSPRSDRQKRPESRN